MFNTILSINLIVVAVCFFIWILMLVLRIWNIGKTEYIKFPFISGILFFIPIIPAISRSVILTVLLLIFAILINITLYFSADTSGVWLMLGKSILAFAALLIPLFFFYHKIFIVGLYVIIPSVLIVMMIFIQGLREIISKILIIFGMFSIPLFLALTNLIFIGRYLCPMSIVSVFFFTLAIFDIIEYKYPIKITVTLLLLSIPFGFFIFGAVTGLVIKSINQINEFARVNVYDKAMYIISFL